MAIQFSSQNEPGYRYAKYLTTGARMSAQLIRQVEQLKGYSLSLSLSISVYYALIMDLVSSSIRPSWH